MFEERLKVLVFSPAAMSSSALSLHSALFSNINKTANVSTFASALMGSQHSAFTVSAPSSSAAASTSAADIDSLYEVINGAIATLSLNPSEPLPQAKDLGLDFSDFAEEIRQMDEQAKLDLKLSIENNMKKSMAPSNTVVTLPL